MRNSPSLNANGCRQYPLATSLTPADATELCPIGFIFSSLRPAHNHIHPRSGTISCVSRRRDNKRKAEARSIPYTWVAAVTSVWHRAFYVTLGVIAFLAALAPSPTVADPLPGGIQIVSPAYGTSVSGTIIQIQVAIGTDKDASTLKVSLNGNDISSAFTGTPSCSSNSCIITGEVSSGLQAGENLISASVYATSGGSGSAISSAFSW
jgi:hypothetical protein